MVAPETLGTLGILSIPHIIYCYIWFYPKSFIRACKAITKTEGVTIFAEIAAVLKRAHSHVGAPRFCRPDCLTSNPYCCRSGAICNFLLLVHVFWTAHFLWEVAGGLGSRRGALHLWAGAERRYLPRHREERGATRIMRLCSCPQPVLTRGGRHFPLRFTMASSWARKFRGCASPAGFGCIPGRSLCVTADDAAPRLR